MRLSLSMIVVILFPSVATANNPIDFPGGGSDKVCLLNLNGAQSYCTQAHPVPILITDFPVTINLNGGDDQVVIRSGLCSCICAEGYGAYSNYSYGGSTVTVNGHDGLDTIIAGQGNNVFNGGVDDDHLIGYTGNDTMSGSDGYDKIVDTGTVGSQFDVLKGEGTLEDIDCLSDANNAWSVCDCGDGWDQTTETLISCVNCEGIVESCAWSCPAQPFPG